MTGTTNEEMAKQLKEMRQKLVLMKEANEHNVALLTQLKSAYEEKIREVLSEIEEIAANLEDVADPDANEAHHRLCELVERFKG